MKPEPFRPFTSIPPIAREKLTQPLCQRDHLLGSVDAGVSLVEYGDYECPACAEVFPIIKEIQRTMGNHLCFGFRHFPMTHIHPHSEHAAAAAEAAGVQGQFWKMHDLLFEYQESLEDEDLVELAELLALDEERLIHEVQMGVHAERIREDLARGVREGVTGTPTFFINGIRYDGVRGLKPLLEAIRKPRCGWDDGDQ